MKGYDPACFDLARHFLGSQTNEADVSELAQHIQDQIEDWLNMNRDDETA